MKTDLGIKVEGHLRVTSYADSSCTEDPVVLLSKRNKIHAENMSLAIARALGGQDAGHVYSLAFGSGGAAIGSTGAITYSQPNVTGAADLNTPIYYEVVDAGRGAPTGNFSGVRHDNGTLFSDLEVRCVIDKGEPFGQPSYDNVSSNVNGSYFFDEVALKTDDGLLLTHLIFSPLEKTANRVFEFLYTLRIRIVTT